VVAEGSLLANVVVLEGGQGLAAGATQFRSLWTRDFCLAACGLLRVGRGDVAREHLELLFAHRRDDGLLPRTLDSIDAKLRVIWVCLRRMLPLLPRPPALRGRPRPEYQDQHGQLAIDGNALAILLALELGRRDPAWWRSHRTNARACFDFYGPRIKRGLVQQPPFSDWQDSVRRKGATLYTNLLVWAAARGLADVGYDELDLPAQRLRAAIERTFRPPGATLLRSVAAKPYVSLDGNLLAIELGFYPTESEEARHLYAVLLESPFWTRDGTPGWNTAPDYPPSWRNPGVQLVGLGHYHDRIRWSWLTSLAAKVSVRMNDLDTARQALEHLSACAARDGTICEIYEERPSHRPWRSLLYRSEAPFSWGAGMCLDALHAYAEASGVAGGLRPPAPPA
jgi:hypothetical protein